MPAKKGRGKAPQKKPRAPRRLTHAQEMFAALVAGGESAASAYRLVHPKAGLAAAETNGPRCARLDQVAIRIADLKAAAKARADASFGMSRLEMLNWLLDIMRKPIGEVHEMHHLAQEFTITETAMGGSKKVKMPGKLEAAEKIIKIMGWNSPEELKLDYGVSEEGLAKLNSIFGPPKAK